MQEHLEKMRASPNKKKGYLLPLAKRRTATIRPIRAAATPRGCCCAAVPGAPGAGASVCAAVGASVAPASAKRIGQKVPPPSITVQTMLFSMVLGSISHLSPM